MIYCVCMIVSSVLCFAAGYYAGQYRCKRTNPAIRRVLPRKNYQPVQVNMAARGFNAIDQDPVYQVEPVGKNRVNRVIRREPDSPEMWAENNKT